MRNRRGGRRRGPLRRRLVLIKLLWWDRGSVRHVHVIDQLYHSRLQCWISRIGRQCFPSCSWELLERPVEHRQNVARRVAVTAFGILNQFAPEFTLHESTRVSQDPD